MISLSLEQVIELSKKGNTIPLYTTIPADLLTPISAYLKYLKCQPNTFLFESVLPGEQIGRYSFLGGEPRKIMVQNQQDPLLGLEQELKNIQPVQVEGLPHFTGGAVGYIGYDCVRYFEPRTNRPLKDTLEIPESILFLCDSIVIFDHLYSVIKIVSNVILEKGDQIELKYQMAVDKIKSIKHILEHGEIEMPKQQPITTQNEEGVSNIGQEGYESFVHHLKKHIVMGDIIQAVPSQRVVKKTDLHPFNAYRTLRTVNPSPYMFYVNLGNFQLVGASPEVLVKVEDNIVTTAPIAGTRPRGKTPQEDNELAKDLLSDLKERSEHVMLVDLGRNDINRICEPQTVAVDSLMHIEKYAHVMHIVSQVSGKLRSDKTRYDAFRSVFPAGTLSGAPKVRAMELIYDCEKEKRGVYGGAVGWFGYSGNLDTCIAIRTMVFKDGKAYLQAGGGIVHDSVPEAEWNETVNKLRSNVVALQKAEAQFQ
ncbi:ADC synthase [Gorgonomyces haynaldii]|nr:ADC synthase [Gorgonomyces haynaldii]